MTDRAPAPLRPTSVSTQLSGGRATVVVTPDQVWAAPSDAPPSAPSPEPARHGFLGPVMLVVVLSSGLLALFLGAVALWLWLKR